MAQVQSGTLLFLPMTTRGWSNPQGSYKYLPPSKERDDNGKEIPSGYGNFRGSGGEAVYAPEGGLLVPAGDGTAILQVEGGKREWFFLNPIFSLTKKDETVRAGDKLGLSEGSLMLALVIDGNPVDPVKYLIENKAKFVDKVATIEGERRRDPRPAESTPHTTEPTARSSEIQTTTATPDEIRKAKPVTYKHVLAAGLGGVFIGGLVAYGMRKR